MRIEELSVGDWVRHTFYEENVRIARIYGDSERVLAERGKLSISCHLNHFEPIPISPEILKMNGWRNDKADRNFWATDEVYIYNHDGIWRLRPKSPELLIVVDVKYIHELQHALRLLGVEKEIEL